GCGAGAACVGGVRELERAVDAVVVGESERRVAELRRPRGELLGMRGAVEERVRRMAVELDVAAHYALPRWHRASRRPGSPSRGQIRPVRRSPTVPAAE